MINNVNRLDADIFDTLYDIRNNFIGQIGIFVENCFIIKTIQKFNGLFSILNLLRKFL